MNIEYKGRKSSLNVEKYIVKSTVEMRGEKKIRVWICPYEKFNKKFGTSRKCIAHLNEHLNRYYECPICLYKSYSLDGYEHHICFKGPKTQGEQKYTNRKGYGRKRVRRVKRLKRGGKLFQLLQYRNWMKRVRKSDFF